MPDENKSQNKSFGDMLGNALIDILGTAASRDPMWSLKRKKFEQDLQDVEFERKVKKATLDMHNLQMEEYKRGLTTGKIPIEDLLTGGFEALNKPSVAGGGGNESPDVNYGVPETPVETQKTTPKFDLSNLLGKGLTLSDVQKYITPIEGLLKKEEEPQEIKEGVGPEGKSIFGLVGKKTGRVTEVKGISPVQKAEYTFHFDTGRGLYFKQNKNTGDIQQYDPETQNWVNPKTLEPIEKSQSEEQLTHTSMFDPNPTKRSQAVAVLNQMKKTKIEVGAMQAGANETAKMNADKNEAIAIIKQSNLVQRLLTGKTAPSDISQSFRQPWVRILAVGEAMNIDPNFNEIQADANKQWYASTATQRLIRRTESIVAPGGAVDESIRIAKEVNNPAGTPINKVTGKIGVALGNSKRALLTLVQGISSEEVQQIMGAQGGGERFLQFTQGLNDPNLSVEQYVNNAKELKYLIITRQLANTRGTPEQTKWEKFAEQTSKERPFAPIQPGTVKTKVINGVQYYEK